MIGIISYGAGNLGNLLRGIRRGGHEAEIMERPENAEKARLLLLPGVGAFPPAMKALKNSGWAEKLIEWHEKEQPLLGICLGMQLLCEISTEQGSTPGLGFFEGTVEKLRRTKRLPHMGWNSLEWSASPDSRTASLAEKTCFYFVHSYGVMESPEALATTTTDACTFISVLSKNHLLGMQFHPERSGPEGIAFLSHILESFLRKGRLAS